MLSNSVVLYLSLNFNMPKNNDTYQTILKKSNGIFKEKGSKFIAHAYPVNNLETIKTIIHELKKEFYDARHICYAYRLGYDGEDYRINDDGEPSGTAGKPIYGQLLSHEITNVLVTVIRYFGGTKLGVSGLINAYKSATIDALNNNKIEDRIIYQSLNLSFSYPQMNAIMKIVKNFNLVVLAQDFKLKCTMQLAVRLNDYQNIKSQLQKIDGVQLEEL